MRQSARIRISPLRKTKEADRAGLRYQNHDDPHRSRRLLRKLPQVISAYAHITPQRKLSPFINPRSEAIRNPRDCEPFKIPDERDRRAFWEVWRVFAGRGVWCRCVG